MSSKETKKNKTTNTKKPVNAKKSTASKKPVKKKSNYFKGVWSELKKVNWPNKKTLWTYTYVVIGAIFASALFIYVADAIISAVFRMLN